MPEKDPAKITLNDVRLSFPQLWTPKAMEGSESEPKFSATFILDNTKHAATLDLIDATMDKLALDHWKKKVPFKRCLKDGNEKADKDGYGDGVSFINASRKTRPAVVDRDPAIPVTEADGKVFAGCYVNAVIRLWVQDNRFGKRVNAELLCVQYYREGEAFGAGKVNAEEEFRKIDEEVAGQEAAKRQRSGAPKPVSMEDF